MTVFSIPASAVLGAASIRAAWDRDPISRHPNNLLPAPEIAVR